MKLKLKKPWGMHPIGTVLRPRNDSLAQMLIKEGFADRIKEPKAKGETETAEAPGPPETAAVRTRRPRRRKKRKPKTPASESPPAAEGSK